MTRKEDELEHHQVMFMLDPDLASRVETRPSWRLPARTIRPGSHSDLPYGEERALRIRRGR
ncbi:MAG: hypothetical protein QOH26_1351 [Actinomycetota bacterium]|nr:hypothetical protein [Actinomycetota bacterium]